MPPATRSSAPSAPSTPARPRVHTASHAPPTPPSSSTRRTPHCTKCHRPRAGHPRSGCPYADASIPSPTSPSARKPAPSAALVVPADEDGLSDEPSSLRIVSPAEDERARQLVPPTAARRRLSVRFALVPEQTLASLSPSDAHLVEQLLQPGIVSDTVTPEDRVAHVLNWQRTLDDADPPKQELAVAKAEPSACNAVPSLSRTMPCTLATPTASLTTTEPVSDRHIGGSAVDMNQTVYLLPEHDVRKKIPLGRSMSCEQRSLFLQQLNHSSGTAPATLLSIPLADLDNVRSDAEKVGFHVRVLPPSRQDDHKWVVLGTDEDAINLLAQKFLEEENRSMRAKGKDNKLTAVAGGVVFGAVATWTGLAFS